MTVVFNYTHSYGPQGSLLLGKGFFANYPNVEVWGNPTHSKRNIWSNYAYGLPGHYSGPSDIFPNLAFSMGSLL